MKTFNIILLIILSVVLTVDTFIIIDLDETRIIETKKRIRLQKEVRVLEANQKRILKKIGPIEVTVTAYSPRKSETDSSPFTTAFQTNVCDHCVAVSRDLFLEHGWVQGKRIYIYQLGVFKIIQDLMPQARADGTLQTKHIDVFFFSTKAAKKFGTKKALAILIKEI